MGHVEFLKATYILMVVSEVIIICVSYIMIRFFRREDIRRTYSLGYSWYAALLLHTVALY